MTEEFNAFPKIPRLSRECTVTEKIDGTNASVFIGEDGTFLVGSRKRWITPENDNFGFARWAYEHEEELRLLGPGHHFGEWWGNGIQRNYSMPEKRFSLFNTSLWSDFGTRPLCCSVVPVLYCGKFHEYGVMKGVKLALKILSETGSVARPGFMSPEGIMIYHHAAQSYMKMTMVDDEKPKGQV